MLLESGIISRVLDRTSLGFPSYLVAFKIVSQVNDSLPLSSYASACLGSSLPQRNSESRDNRSFSSGGR